MDGLDCLVLRVCWERGIQSRMCSHAAHLWATSDFVPRSEALRTPRAA